MLTVLPIQEKNIQEELCKICGAEFDTNSFAYRADDGVFLGICQFRFVSEVGEISALKYAPDIKDDEAMIIMLRTAMNFMHRCGLKKSVFLAGSAPQSLLDISSYGKDEDGNYEIDLDKFYISPCHYNK